MYHWQILKVLPNVWFLQICLFFKVLWIAQPNYGMLSTLILSGFMRVMNRMSTWSSSIPIATMSPRAVQTRRSDFGHIQTLKWWAHYKWNQIQCPHIGLCHVNLEADFSKKFRPRTLSLFLRFDLIFNFNYRCEYLMVTKEAFCLWPFRPMANTWHRVVKTGASKSGIWARQPCSKI